MPPDFLQVCGTFGALTFFPCTFKISRYAASYRYFIAYEINAQGWKKSLGLEVVGRAVIARGGGGYNFHM